MLDEALMRQPTAAWIERLAGKVPVAPVFDIAQALENPFVHERGGVRDYHYADGRNARMIADPIRVPGVDLPQRARAAHGRAQRGAAARRRLRRRRIAKLRSLGVIADCKSAHATGQDVGHAAGP